MKRYTYIGIALVILGLLSFTTAMSDGLRSAVVGWVSFSRKVDPGQKELESLRLENHNLKAQVELLKVQVELEKLISDQAELLKQFSKDDEFSKRRKAEIFRRMELYVPSVVGRVIFRESGSWNTSFWIDVGEKTNQALGRIVVGKNSPVVVGTSVVGVVEYVGGARSRVRLITDSALVPSVRAVRDGLFLAKGELRGLRGVGFNFDFDDAEGPGRELSSDLVKAGDLLVTTGMDGVFPAGLRVGVVTRVFPLAEGQTSFELEAKSAVKNFSRISFVTVLPPLD